MLWDIVICVAAAIAGVTFVVGAFVQVGVGVTRLQGSTSPSGVFLLTSISGLALCAVGVLYAGTLPAWAVALAFVPDVFCGACESVLAARQRRGFVPVNWPVAAEREALDASDPRDGGTDRADADLTPPAPARGSPSKLFGVMMYLLTGVLMLGGAALGLAIAGVWN